MSIQEDLSNAILTYDTSMVQAIRQARPNLKPTQEDLSKAISTYNPLMVQAIRQANPNLKLSQEDLTNTTSSFIFKLITLFISTTEDLLIAISSFIFIFKLIPLFISTEHLSNAISTNDTLMVKAIRQACPNLKPTQKDLSNAISTGKPLMVQAILQADPNLKPTQKDLSNAILTGEPLMVQAILQADPNLNPTPEDLWNGIVKSIKYELAMQTMKDLFNAKVKSTSTGEVFANSGVLSEIISFLAHPNNGEDEKPVAVNLATCVK